MARVAEMVPAALLLAVFGIVTGMGAVITARMNETVYTDTTAAEPVFSNILGALEDFSDWADLIALAIAGSVILTLVIGTFMPAAGRYA